MVQVGGKVLLILSDNPHNVGGFPKLKLDFRSMHHRTYAYEHRKIKLFKETLGRTGHILFRSIKLPRALTDSFLNTSYM